MIYKKKCKRKNKKAEMMCQKAQTLNAGQKIYKVTK